MASPSQLESFILVLLSRARESERLSGIADEVGGAYYFPDIPKSACLHNKEELAVGTGKKIARLINQQPDAKELSIRKRDPQTLALAGLLGGGADAFLKSSDTEEGEPERQTTKIDRLRNNAKAASLASEIMQHKNEPWFYPTAGGLAGILLASPEAIGEMKEDKAPQALRRLILSGGLGAGIGYIGRKAIKGELSDLKEKLDSLKDQAPTS